MKTFDPDYPIILGLCGKAGTGKTSVAEYIVPNYSVKFTPQATWDHLFFAMPLYEMASIKRGTLGDLRADRVAYRIHDTLLDLFGASPMFGAPKYDELVTLVKDIATAPIPMDDEIKPRDFLQQTGIACRAIKETCFAEWAVKKVYSRMNTLQDAQVEDLPFIGIISDVRFVNEAEAIAKQPNGLVIKFEASEKVREKRLFERDGHHMTEEQKNHISERVELIDPANIYSVIDTDNLTIQEQAKIVEQTVLEYAGAMLNA